MPHSSTSLLENSCFDPEFDPAVFSIITKNTPMDTHTGWDMDIASSSSHSRRHWGRTEPKKKLNRLRSVKLSKLPSSKSLAGEARKSRKKPPPIQASPSPSDSESSVVSDLNTKSLNPCVGKSVPEVGTSGRRAVMTIKRMPSIRSRVPVTNRPGTHTLESDSGTRSSIINLSLKKTGRSIVKMGSFKSKNKPSPQFRELSIDRATCSSAFKNAKRPDTAESFSPTKVCPYHYCGLHAHHHSHQPNQLKRVMSRKRWQVKKTQKCEDLVVTSKIRATPSRDRKGQGIEACLGHAAIATGNVGMTNASEGNGGDHGLNRVDAVVELINEAVDEIFPPEIEDGTWTSSDYQSIAADPVPCPESPLGGSKESSRLGEKSTMTLVSGGKWARADSTRSEGQPRKGWSGLKKALFLKRMIKELQKVKKINPRAPRPLEPMAEAEKVFLKHQTAGETKNYEKWLLDYALRQVVARLTTARKRKVKMLVEAFETVSPVCETKNTQIAGGSADQETTSHSTAVSSVMKCNGKCSQPDHEKRKGPLQSDPQSNGTFSSVDKILQDEGISMNMWRLLHQSAVSYITETQLPFAREEKEQEVDGTGEIHRKVSGTHQEDAGSESSDASSQDSELNQTNAIKLVKEAFDAMLSPEMEEKSSPGVYSNASATILDQNLSQNKHGDGEGSLRKLEKPNAVMSSLTLGHEERQPQANCVNPPKMEGVSEQKLSKKNWMKVKKIILLKRFVKEVDKVRNFNPRGPRFLSPEPGSEAEKVSLRHQMMSDRKSTEEWMLDHALRQVVAELTPARKRRVALLVEAFETVNPSSETRPHTL